MRDWERTVISQYSDSPVLCTMLDLYNQAVDPLQNFQDFYNLIWNIETAVGYGLDIWGRVVGINRVITVAAGGYFGFTGATGHSGDSWNAGIFYSGQPATSNYALTDKAFRQLIFAKAAANITDDSIPSINTILRLLFPARGACYVVDHLDMTMDYVFEFPLEPFEVSIVTNSSVLPTPVGVLANVIYS